MFQTVPLSIIRSFSLYTQQWYMSYRFADSSWAVGKLVWHMPLLRVQWKTPDDGQRNCRKHVEFHSKNEFEKLVHLVGFILRNINIVYLLMLLSFFTINCFENIFLPFWFSATFIFTTLKKKKKKNQHNQFSHNEALEFLSLLLQMFLILSEKYYHFPLLFCSGCGQVADWATLMQYDSADKKWQSTFLNGPV